MSEPRVVTRRHRGVTWLDEERDLALSTKLGVLILNRDRGGRALVQIGTQRGGRMEWNSVHLSKRQAAKLREALR